MVPSIRHARGRAARLRNNVKTRRGCRILARVTAPASLAHPHAASHLVQRALRLSVVDGLLNAVMVGAAESYLGAFAVELGHGATNLALLTTLPLLSGALAQLVGPGLSARVGSRRRFIVTCAVVQALSLLLFYAVAALRAHSLWALLGAKLLFWVSSLVMTPAWSAWMAQLTEHVPRERYFALRSGAVQGALMIAFGAAGTALNHAPNSDALLKTYRVLFVVALCARLGSALALHLQPDPGPAASLSLPAPGERLRLALRTSDWRLALYLAALMLGAQLSIPFFTPFLLRELHFSYGAFAGLTAVSLFAKAVAFPVCHPLSARIGLKPLVIASGLSVSALPLLWAVWSTHTGLLLAQVLSGIGWAGMEFATFQLLLNSARPECRYEFLSLANSLSGVAQVIGAVVGALLIGTLGYRTVFLCSALGRGLSLGFLLLSVRHLTLPARLPRIFLRLISVRPSGGATHRPIVTDAPPRPDGRRPEVKDTLS